MAVARRLHPTITTMDFTAPTDHSERLAGHRVVVLDDDALMRRALVETLEGAGHRTFAAEHGAEVLECLSDFRPDVIILDMLLPQMDGFEFLARLRAHPTGSQTPVIILSNLGESLVDCIDPDAAQALGVTAILAKSIPLSMLLDRLARLVTPARSGESR